MKTFKAICIKQWADPRIPEKLILFAIYTFKAKRCMDGDYEIIDTGHPETPEFAETKHSNSLSNCWPLFEEHFMRIPTRAAIQSMEQDHNSSRSGGSGVHLRAPASICGAGRERTGDVHQHGDVPGGDSSARSHGENDADDLVTDQVAAGSVPGESKADLRKRSPRRGTSDRTGMHQTRKGAGKCR